MKFNKREIIIVAVALIVGLFAGLNMDPLVEQGLMGVGVTNLDRIQLDGTTDPVLDLTGNCVDLDDDGDSSLCADTDDQIDFELGGADVWVMKALAAADGGATTNALEIAYTTPVDTTGTNTHNSFVCDLAIGNATGGTNVATCIQIDTISGDAQVTETAINIGTGWDTGITNASATTLSGTNTLSGANTLSGTSDFTYVQSADAAAVGDSLEVAFTSPVDTTGANTHNAMTVDLAIGNATGGTNHVRGLQIDAITGDAQVVETAINIGSGYDYAIDTAMPAVLTAQTAFADFLGDTVPPEWDYDSGSGASDPALNAAQYGTLRASTPGTDTNFATDHAGVDMGGVFWSADQGSMVFEARVKIDNITNAQWCVGLTDTETMEMPASIGGSDAITTTASDALVFCFDTGADTDEWFVIGVAGDTDATGNGATGTAPVAGTYQVLRIEADIAGADARFYIDGTLAGTLTANAVTVTDLLTPVIVVDNLAAEAKNVDIDYIYVSADRQ